MNQPYTVSQGTGHKLLAGKSDMEFLNSNNSANGKEFMPVAPKRTTSLFGTADARFSTHVNGQSSTLRTACKPRETSSLNPKRISIATSTFWEGSNDIANLVGGWELGRNTMKANSVWDTSESGSGECVNIWGDPPAVKKGVLLQQREKLWSRWKERYCILTRDYLHCFRRSTSIHKSGVRLSEMGSFIFKLRLAEVEDIEWESRRNGSLISVFIPNEPRILFRVLSDNHEALYQWYTLLQECVYMSKERRQALRNFHGSNTHKSYATNKSLGSRDSSHSNSNSSSLEMDKTSSLDDSQESGERENSLRKNLARMSIIGPSDSTYTKYSEKPPSDDIMEESRDNLLLDSTEFEDKVILRREKSSLTLRDFIKSTNSRPNSVVGLPTDSTGFGVNCNNRSVAMRMNSGRNNNNNNGTRNRPESWAPQPHLFYRSPSLVPSQWVHHHKKDLPVSRGGTTFGRSTMMYCPANILPPQEINFRHVN